MAETPVRSWSQRGQLFELTRVRVLMFLREPEAIFWVFIFPVVLAAVLGFAFQSKSPEPNPIGILLTAEEAGQAVALVGILEGDEMLEVTRFLDREVARRELRKSVIDILLIPDAPPVLEFNAERDEAELARVRILRAMELAASGGEEAVVSLEPVTERGSRFVDFLYPGLIGMNLMGTSMWGIGFAIADIRRRRLLRRMLVTPMRRTSFFLSFVLARLVFLALELSVLLLIGNLVLDVPIRGSLFSIVVLSLAGAACFAGIGILAASRARTLEGVSGLMNLVMMPMWLGSGVFFSYERFPEALHPVLRALPLTGLNDALRALMLDGDSLLSVAPALGLQFVWGAATLLIALKVFRWD